MKVVVHGQDWNKLGLDDPSNYNRAIAAFYCGYGLHRIYTMLQSTSDEEWMHVIDTARALGLDSTDCLIER